MKSSKATNILISALVACLIQVLNSSSFGQSFSSDAPQIKASTSHAEEKSATYAPVGPSGYKVLIPEIKMNQIIGEVKPKPQAVEPEPAQTKKAPPEGTRQDQKEHSSDFAGPHTTETEDSAIARLPFDHSARKMAPSPAKQDLSHDFKKTIDRETPLLGPPVAPINITEALPEPRKELLPKRQSAVVPKIKELQAAKIQTQVSPIKPLTDQHPLAPEDWIYLQTRKNPEELPLEESTTEAVVKAPQPEPLETRENLVKETIEKEGEDQRQPVGETPIAAEEKEKHVVQEPKDDPGEVTGGQIAVSVAPKEQIPSPLDEQALTEKGMRLYLSETTPVLEELSLLMARAPSLSLADYDPSEINTVIAPQDLTLKLESMKRELRILDSKIFSIIPPANYSEFHNLIRQSISHTYLACEAISNYFHDSRLEDLHKVNEHLMKARELIKLTRKTNGST
ncbi:MAG: hypothetical protein QG663_1527 [Thermodesulfobacteriota bacterium]|nr:hypothetical protein [Thermodesulfobacteriota bacterium]